MYADRRTDKAFKPGSLGVALGISGAMIGGLFFAAPDIAPFILKPADPLITYVVPEPKPVPVEPADNPAPRPQPRLQTPPPPLPIPKTNQGVEIDALPYVPPIPAGGGVGTGTGTGVGVGPIDPPKPVPPLIVQPGIDPRYAADFQPTYPPAERRAEREGRVVVRVLIGTDGRVKQVERVEATSDAFYRTTLERALARWRFKPGTRDGAPVESWKTMTLTFVLEN